jgi:hypothetical protein
MSPCPTERAQGVVQSIAGICSAHDSPDGLWRFGGFSHASP